MLKQQGNQPINVKPDKDKFSIEIFTAQCLIVVILIEVLI